MGPDGVLVRADAGDIAHIALRKPEFSGRLEWVLDTIVGPAVIWEDAAALPGRPRVLYDRTTSDVWGNPWRVMAVAKPAPDGTRKLVTAMAPTPAYWANHAKKVIWRVASD